jgi:hypothetical protein
MPEVPNFTSCNFISDNVTYENRRPAATTQNWSFRPAPSIPIDGKEGDVLIMRNGQPTWVSPQEAFRLDVSAARDGQQMTRELFEQLIKIIPREHERHSIPRPPEPGPPTEKFRNAWEIILDDE